MKVWLDPHSPVTNFLLGAIIFGADPEKAVGSLVKNESGKEGNSSKKPSEGRQEHLLDRDSGEE
jgi:hypothetical protein